MPRRTLYPEGKNQDIIVQPEYKLHVLEHKNGSRIIIGAARTEVYIHRPNHMMDGHVFHYITRKDMFDPGTYAVWKHHYRFPLYIIRKAQQIVHSL